AAFRTFESINIPYLLEKSSPQLSSSARGTRLTLLGFPGHLKCCCCYTLAAFTTTPCLAVGPVIDNLLRSLLWDAGCYASYPLKGILGTLHTQCRWGTDLKSSSSRKTARSNDFLFEQVSLK
ncbi:MAG: hypothetical protein K8S15_12395, partial [Candidatus Aegiribacteria sp.]|nr:hypothetical protein [Candidatus Aegiribacteria sp.]